MLSGKKAALRPVSPSHEHYLRAIWEVRKRHGYARLTDVARELGLSHPTLSVGLKSLEERRLVAHDENRFLELTPSGERAARQVHHRYRVLLIFLREVLGVPATLAEREACLLEHDVSPETTERLVNLIKLMEKDRSVRSVFRQRLPRFHRSCSPSETCETCGLSCLEPSHQTQLHTIRDR